MRYATLLAAAIFVSAPTFGAAQRFDPQRHGVWLITRTLSDAGNRLCSMGTRFPDGRSFYVKYFENTNYLIIHVFKSSWRMPERTQVPIRMAVDSHNGWQATALGMNNLLQWRIGINKLMDFMQQFRNGTILRLHFPSGNENDWIIRLSGSDPATHAFAQCVRTIEPRPPTQPHTPTQPHRK